MYNSAGGDDSDIESVKVVRPLKIINDESASNILTASELESCSLPVLFKVTREELIREQSVDSSLKPYFVLASQEKRMTPTLRKTYDRVVRRFFWPKLRKDDSWYIKSCHVCQLTGKPNQKIPVAPLQPIPAVSNPFEHFIVNCVGPLPRSKAGHPFLLTVMCQSMRYPAAYPLRSITTKSVLKALTDFMLTFGIPKIIQSDHGSNFMSKQFVRAL